MKKVNLKFKVLKDTWSQETLRNMRNLDLEGIKTHSLPHIETYK